MSPVALTRAEPSFAERVSNLLQRVDYRPAITDEDKEQIYRLRYDAYIREGTISPSFGKRLSDKYDDLDNAWIFGVYVDGQLASSIRLNVSSSICPDLPGLMVFPDIIGPEIEAGKTIIDPTRFVVDQAAARQYPELPYVTVRVGWMAGDFFVADAILATVRAEHQAFYRRVFGHRLMCEPRPYPSLTKPISLMSLDYFGMKDRVHHRYPFFRSTYFERRMLFGHPGMPEQWQVEEAARKAIPRVVANENRPALVG
jgi:hypothetical protein